MTLQVLFFSTLRQATGENEVTIQLAEESMTVSGLLEFLYAQFPGLRDWDQQILVAVDQDYAERSMALHDGQEVAIMPPVQGG